MSTALPGQTLRQISDLPCPRGLPIVGNLLQLSPPRMHLILERWAAELGTPYRFQVGSLPITKRCSKNWASTVSSPPKAWRGSRSAGS